MKEVIAWRRHSFVLFFASVHRRLPKSATSLTFLLSFATFFFYKSRDSAAVATTVLYYETLLLYTPVLLASFCHVRKKNEEGAKIDVVKGKKTITTSKQNNSKFHLGNNSLSAVSFVYLFFVFGVLHYAASYQFFDASFQLAKAKIGNFATTFKCF
jgi:hypothetical protein